MLICYKTINVSWSSSCATQKIKRIKSYIQILEGVRRKLRRSFCDCFLQMSEKLSKVSTTHLYKSARNSQSFSVYKREDLVQDFHQVTNIYWETCPRATNVPQIMLHSGESPCHGLLAELMFTCCAFYDSSGRDPKFQGFHDPKKLTEKVKDSTFTLP